MTKNSLYIKSFIINMLCSVRNKILVEIIPTCNQNRAENPEFFKGWTQTRAKNAQATIFLPIFNP